MYTPQSYSVNTARTDSLTVQANGERQMELIHKDGFVKVYAAKVGNYICLWETDYPSKNLMIATCENMKQAKETAELYADCINNGVAF